MRTLVTACALATALHALLPVTTEGQIRDRTALVAALDSAARAHVANDMVAGISVAVVRGADTLLLRGYGQADLEWNVPTPPDASASYEIGSVTKQFTATAILQLVEQGKLDLDADFTEYLPDFDTRGHVVPLRRLLDHTSGIPSYTEMAVFGDISIKDLPRDTLVSLVEAEPFDFEPGTAQIYNNSAFFLLGLIIEKVSGQPYEAYVREHLFEPAGMAASYYCSERAIRAGRAHGYDAGADGLERKGYLDHTWPYAAGSLCSTAGDLIRWNDALHGGRLLSAASYRALTTPLPLRDGTPLTYAMGLGVGERAGLRVISHSGGINGFLSDGRYYPEQDVVTIVLQNTAGPRGPGALASTFADLIFGPVPAPVAAPYTGDLDVLVGEYAGPARGNHLHLTVSRDGDQLVLTARGQEEGFRPVHVGDGVWQIGGTRYSFDVAGGRSFELKIAQGSGRYMLKRIPPNGARRP
jgi:CubicO group peptidase (beta-lactamase class C family)